jgi:hypothetical protein
MAEKPPSQVLALKKDTQQLVAISVCRSCFMKNSLKHKPHMAYADPIVCAIKGCENPSAYMVSLTPYEMSQ